MDVAGCLVRSRLARDERGWGSMVGAQSGRRQGGSSPHGRTHAKESRDARDCGRTEAGLYCLAGRRRRSRAAGACAGLCQREGDGEFRHLAASADKRRWRGQTYHAGRSGSPVAEAAGMQRTGDALPGRIRQDAMNKTKGGRCPMRAAPTGMKSKTKCLMLYFMK